MKDSQYLKQYVQKHPENKMAWYLLGKEYHKNGQEGKANYCFNEAGGVYEAFEHSKVPAELLREYEQGLVWAGRQRDQNRRKIRYLLLGLFMLFMIIIPPAVAPGIYMNEQESERSSDTLTASDVTKPGKSTAGTIPSAAGGVVFTAAETGQEMVTAKGITTLLSGKESSPLTAVLGMKRSGQWLLWQERLPLDYTLEKTENGRVEYQSYNAAACSCQPPEAGKLLKKAAQWQDKQEELGTLSSAIRAFRNSKGRMPATLKELTGQFPGNWLAGTTPFIKQAFEPLKEAVAAPNGEISPAGELPGSNQEIPDKGQGQSNATASQAAGFAMTPFLTEPMSIIVDKQKHRLAVVSGSVLIRNYEVGLGGGRTPMGDFVITDKVVNPNGSDKGEFGSRGMQLSGTNYAIHGTNKPDSIGKDESLGCIRMKRADVEELFALVPMGTKVKISKGVLPAELLLPKERFSPSVAQKQTNPRKVYHWLN
ncbi:L,D-transpeptidase [Paenibacillus sp. sgz500958]|uniref:L,D-transpeptidase n=1 Tax=Paenibacillus sp. sgz500958 TaxID=3242475 RepID=UPI0036D35046